MSERNSMMTIDRKPGKRIRLDLGDGRTGWITATIVQKTLHGDTRDEVRLFVELPRSVRVDREEVYNKRLAALQLQEQGDTDECDS